MALTEEKRNACGILVGKHEGKRTRRPQWSYCFKLDNKERERGRSDRMCLAGYLEKGKAVLDTVVKNRVP